MSDQAENPAPAQEEQPKDAADAQEKPAAEQQESAPEGGTEEKKEPAGAEGGGEEKEPAGAEGGGEEKKEPAGAEGGGEEKKEGDDAEVTEQKEGILCMCTYEVKLLLERHNAYMQERNQLQNQRPPNDPSLCEYRLTQKSSMLASSHDEVSSKEHSPPLHPLCSPPDTLLQSTCTVGFTSQFAQCLASW